MPLTPLLLAAQLAGSVPAPSPPFSALTSPTDSARYAWEEGCLAALRSGTDVATVANPYIDRTDIPRDGAIRTHRMTGAGKVVLVDGLGASCTMAVGRGDADALEAMVLEARPGVAWRPLAPSTEDFTGTYGFCGQIGDRPAYLSITKPKTRQGLRFIASMSVDPSPRCDGGADRDLSRIPDSR